MQTKTLSAFSFALSVILIITGAFMAVLDTTIVDIIVPRLQGPLSTDIYGVQWVITAYMIAAAVALLIIEPLIHKFTAKRVYIFGVGLFAFSSLMCGLSDSLSFIVFSRSVQGFAEALVMVTSQAMMFKMFPPEKKGLAMGIFALGVAFAPAVGPTLGGYLAEWFSWRAVFFINVPIGFLIVIFGALLLPNRDESKSVSVNIVSVIFLSLATVSLLVVLSRGQKEGWFNSPFIVYLAFTSVIAILLFGLNETVSKRPLFDYREFKNYFYSIGILLYFVLLGFSMYQYFYLIPIYYEKLKGLSSIQTGLGVLGFGAWIGVFSIVAGILSDKFSPLYVLLAGVLLYLLSAFFLFPTLNYYTPFHEAVLKTMPFGIAMGMFFAPITTLILVNSKNNEQAIAVMDYVRFVGGSFGTAIATNNLYFYSDREFLGMNEMQNYQSVDSFLNAMSQKFGIISKVIFGDLEKFMSFNYGFKYVWLDAAFWGAVGSMFIFMLFLKRRNNAGEKI